MSDETIEARKKAMDYLARREHGASELIAKLIKSGFEAQVAESAVAELGADGLQSDQRFVDAFIQSRINQGKGPARIRAELRERSIDDQKVEIGLDEAEVDWFALAVVVRLKKFGAARPEEWSQKAKQMRFLQSRGFETGQIQAAVSADAESA